MSYNLDTLVVNSSAKEENDDKDIVVTLDSRHTAVLSRKAGKTSIAVLGGKYNTYCTKEIFPEYNQDIVRVEDDEAKSLIREMLMIFKR